MCQQCFRDWRHEEEAGEAVLRPLRAIEGEIFPYYFPFFPCRKMYSKTRPYQEARSILRVVAVDERLFMVSSPCMKGGYIIRLERGRTQSGVKIGAVTAVKPLEGGLANWIGDGQRSQYS